MGENPQERVEVPESVAVFLKASAAEVQAMSGRLLLATMNGAELGLAKGTAQRLLETLRCLRAIVYGVVSVMVGRLA